MVKGNGFLLILPGFSNPVGFFWTFQHVFD